MAAPAAGQPVQNAALPATAAAGPLGALVDGCGWSTTPGRPRRTPLRAASHFESMVRDTALPLPTMTGRSTVIVGWPSMGAGDAAVYENVNQKRSRPGDEQEVGCGTRGLVKLQNAKWAEMRAARVPRGTRRSKVLLSTILDKRCPY